MLNTDRAEWRRSARVSVGISDAFSSVSDLGMLESLVNDPDEAQATQDRQKAQAEMEEIKLNTAPYNGAA